MGHRILLTAVVFFSSISVAATITWKSKYNTYGYDRYSEGAAISNAQKIALARLMPYAKLCQQYGGMFTNRTVVDWCTYPPDTFPFECWVDTTFDCAMTPGMQKPEFPVLAEYFNADEGLFFVIGKDRSAYTNLMAIHGGGQPLTFARLTQTDEKTYVGEGKFSVAGCPTSVTVNIEVLENGLLYVKTTEQTHLRITFQGCRWTGTKVRHFNLDPL